ncbi:MAG: hypothetical protein U0W24_16050 [Bacteroidales bacterium]
MRTKALIPLILLSLAIFLFNCTSEIAKFENHSGGVASCEGCHTDYNHLKKVYSPDTTAPAGGCGGEAPHYEPYDRVYMGGEGFETYKNSGHYKIGCVACHNGIDNTDDKNLAHSGDFLSHPSVLSDEKCGACHEQIVENFKTSLHQGMGQKRKVTIRSGLTGYKDFDQLPAHQQEGYNKNCATCHASCGSCHIVRPVAGGEGLINGHNFNKTPDMLGVCVACHSSRGGHAYLGVASGTQPDVHLTKMGYKCTNCHSGNELHGDGKEVDQRYAYSKLPECFDCHTSLRDKNEYHLQHYTDFNCQVCHSQVYNNCGSCHIHGDGARIPSYMDFKIAMNPIPDVKDMYHLSLVRRTLAAPDNWEKYGVAEYANFNAFPIFNFASPHNILRWTDRTNVGSNACYSQCHIIKSGDELLNKELYLFDENLTEQWEKEACKNIVVDGKLPSSWLSK